MKYFGNCKYKVTKNGSLHFSLALKVEANQLTGANASTLMKRKHLFIDKCNVANQ